MSTRHLAAVIALVVLAGLAGCGKKGPLEEPPPPKAKTQKPVSP